MLSGGSAVGLLSAFQAGRPLSAGASARACNSMKVRRIPSSYRAVRYMTPAFTRADQGVCVGGGS